MILLLMSACADDYTPGVESTVHTYPEQHCENRSDLVFLPDVGGARDLRSFTGDVLTLDEPGTLMVCEGAFALSLILEADRITVQGLGNINSMLEPTGGAAITTSADNITLSGLRIGRGSGAGIAARGGSMYLYGVLLSELSEVALSATDGAVVDAYYTDIRWNSGGMDVASEADVLLYHSRVDSNERDSDGGGVYLEGGRLSMFQSRISENTPDDLYIDGLGSQKVDSSTDMTCDSSGCGALAW